MFNCHSCMRRHIQGFLGDSILHQVGQKGNIIPQCKGATSRRNSSAVPLTQHQDDAQAVTPQWQRTRDRHGPLSQSTNNGARALERQAWLQSRGSRPSSKPAADLPNTFVTQKELAYLGDPLKLADFVFKFLRSDRFNEAEHFVRTASKHIQCTVSWNHLVDWQMSKGKVNGAIKTYNEMKKRAQAPDAHTYTILFRGMAEFSDYPQTLSKALSIYHSMDANNSPVKPNVIHTNAVLKVCARAKDMDALFGVAAKLQRKGLRAPNNLTFTTILNASRQNALLGPSGTTGRSESRPIRKKAVMDSRKMWDDVISRWHQGDIWIDEKLVCSMGRVLLLGNMQDVDDIFSLVEQTMNIPRILPRLGTPARDKIEPTLQGKVKTVALENTNAVDDSTKDLVAGNEFKVVNPPTPPSQSLSAYARPGPNALSLVLDALYQLRMKASLEEYWTIFTRTHKVVPDSQNYHSYFRCLRLFRASSETVKVLLQMPKSMLQKKSFRIAMSTCARDKNNQLSFSNAGKILDLMQQTLSDLDLPTLHSYLEVALYSPPLSRGDPSTVNGAGSEYVRGRQILRALDRLGAAFINIRSALAYSEPAPSGKGSEAKLHKEAAMALVREMISAYDKLMNHGMVETEKYGRLIRERSKLATVVTRYNEKHLRSKAAGASEKVMDKESTADNLKNQKLNGGSDMESPKYTATQHNGELRVSKEAVVEEAAS